MASDWDRALEQIASSTGATPAELEKLGEAVLAIDVSKIAEAGRAAGQYMASAIRRVAEAQLRTRQLHVERRLLAGENRVEVPYLPGTNDGRTLVYIVPEWKSRPIRRWRIEWRRWCWRRSKAGLLDAVDERGEN